MLLSVFPPAIARLLVFVGGGLLLLVPPLFFVGGPDWVSSPLLHNVWDFGHVMFYALLFIVVQWFVPLPRWQQWLGASLIALVLGLLVELVQHYVGRYASWSDVGNNLAGVWFGLFWGQRARDALYPRTVLWGRWVSVLLMAPALWLVLASGWADFTLRRDFPLLNGFESQAQLRQVNGYPKAVHLRPNNVTVSEGGQSLQLELTPNGYAGIRLRVCYGDWSRYNYLALDLFNPDEQVFPLVLRVSDVVHDRGANKFDDRFNQKMLLQPGWNNLRFAIDHIAKSPKGRTMQLDSVCNLGIFAAGLSHRRSLYLDNIRLE